MGFSYVLIPCSASDDMQELEYEGDIEDLSQDKFREKCEKYFAAIGESVDRSVLLQQLQERTGMDLQDKAAKGEMTEEALSRLLQSTSVEIFPVMLPTKENGFIAISVYCDDKGIAKNLEENPRMSSLVQACGYPGQTFRGDCFIGRVYDDTQDEWRRVSFTLKDCSSDAPWAEQCRKQRANRSSADMSKLAGQIGVNNPAHINPAMLPDQEAPKGETDQYVWKQLDDEVEVTFKKADLCKGDKKLVKVQFGRKHLRVEAKGEVLIDAPLYGPTHPDESTWTLSDGVLQVMLSKANDESWPTLQP